MDEKEYSFNKSQGYKSDALFWNDKANTHYQIFTALITTISISTIGYVSLTFSNTSDFSALQTTCLIFIIVFSSVSIFSALWQNFSDQLFFLKLSIDSSRRQAIWENEDKTEEEKKKIIKKIQPIDFHNSHTALLIQSICLVLIIITTSFLGINNLIHNSQKQTIQETIYPYSKHPNCYLQKSRTNKILPR